MNIYYTNQYQTLHQHLFNFNGKINVSFEFFPPKTKKFEEKLWKSVKKLSVLKPKFISVTYSPKEETYYNTNKIIKKIKLRTGLNIAPHLTCINISKENLHKLAKDYWNSGIRHIIALRGDLLPNSIRKYTMYALDLVKLLKKIEDFDISVAAYPEVHPEAKNAQSDLINLKKKIDAGANRAITQFFFDIDNYLRFRDRCVAIGIDVEIIPGILPIINFKKLKHFSNLTNVYIPKWISNMFEGLDHDLEAQKIIGINIAIEMVKNLLFAGVKNFHFYTLNDSEMSYLICHVLGVKPIEYNNVM